jgi:hypothetical protein
MKKYTGRILALDLASVVGFAHGRPGTVPKFGTQRIAEHGKSRAETYRRFRLWLDLFVSLHKPDLIVFESPAVAAFMTGKTTVDTLKLLYGLSEHLEEWAFRKVELREASVSQVRSHFLGRNMKAMFAKPLTIERCKELGWMVEDSDSADACALWDYQVCSLRPDIGVSNSPLFSSR